MFDLSEPVTIDSEEIPELLSSWDALISGSSNDDSTLSIDGIAFWKRLLSNWSALFLLELTKLVKKSSSNQPVNQAI